MSTGLLETSALRGNTVAMALLGERLARGFCCTPDPARANSIRRVALKLGLPVPEPDATLGFQRRNRHRNPPSRRRFPCSDLSLSAAAAAGDMLDERIHLMVFPELLSAEECLYIQCLGGPQLQPSRSVDPDGTWHQPSAPVMISSSCRNTRSFISSCCSCGWRMRQHFR